MHEEQLKNTAKEEIVDVDGSVAFVAHGNCSSSINKSSLICNVCNQRGHKTNNCFQVLGYPEWWLEKENSIENNGQLGGGRERCTGNWGGGRGNQQ